VPKRSLRWPVPALASVVYENSATRGCHPAGVCTERERMALALASANAYPMQSTTRRFATSSKSGSKPNPFAGKSPYEILEVPKSADVKAIKLAYYKAAKLHHPDMVDESERETARAKFQMIAAAYELLSDPQKRKLYDDGQGMWGRASGANANWQQQQQQANPQSGGTQDWWSSQGSYQSNTQAYEQWENLWDFTKEDRHVVEQALEDYQNDLKEEFLYARDCIQRGDFQEAYNIAKSHKGLILGVGVPVVVVLRFPVLIAVAFTSILRFHKMIEFVFLNALIALKVTGVGKDLWRKVVAMARRRSEARRVERKR